MPETRCMKCATDDPTDYFNVNITHETGYPTRRGPGSLEVQAIFRCSYLHEPHEWPVRIQHNRIVETSESIDPIGTAGLSPQISSGLIQDLIEAAKCYHYGLLKGAVVIARRATQLSLEDKIPGIDRNKKWTLGPLIEAARKSNPPILSDSAFSHASIVLQFGNDGAHNALEIDPRDARTVVWAAVNILAELAPFPSQS